MRNDAFYMEWSGDFMVPLERMRRRCDQEFTVGEVVRLVVEEERSSASHRHFFASVNEAWKNLPEDLASRFVNADHLRQWCLIKCDYADESKTVLDTPHDAMLYAAGAARYITATGKYPVVVVAGCVVQIFTSKSQSVRSMGKKEFQDSKTKVLDLVASMIGVSAGNLAKNADRAA